MNLSQVVNQPKVSTTTIEEAWEVLSKAYGDTQRVMDYYMKAIGELGKFPHKTAGLRSQIEWYIQLESLIESIIELAERDKKLASQAYGGTTLRAILNLFPTIEEQQKLNDLPGEDKEKLDAILADLVKRKGSLQSLIKVHMFLVLMHLKIW